MAEPCPLLHCPMTMGLPLAPEPSSASCPVQVVPSAKTRPSPAWKVWALTEVRVFQGLDREVPLPLLPAEQSTYHQVDTPARATWCVTRSAARLRTRMLARMITGRARAKDRCCIRVVSPSTRVRFTRMVVVRARLPELQQTRRDRRHRITQPGCMGISSTTGTPIGPGCGAGLREDNGACRFGGRQSRCDSTRMRCPLRRCQWTTARERYPARPIRIGD